MIPTYKTSNKAGSGLMTLLPAAIAASAVIGVVYQFVVHYQPFIKINVIVTCLAAVGVGGIVSVTLRLAKCRNRMTAMSLGVAGAIAALIAGHMVSYWIWTHNVPGGVGLADYVEGRVRIGWSISSSSSSSSGGMKISGWGVWTMWGLEVATFLIGAGITAGLRVATPFCERCNLWADRPIVGLLRDDVDGPETTKTLQAANEAGEVLAFLAEPPKANARRPNAVPDKENPVPKGTKWCAIEANMTGCPGCDATRFMSLKVKTEHQAGKKQVAASSADVITNGVLSQDEGREFEMLARGVAPGAGPAGQPAA